MDTIRRTYNLKEKWEKVLSKKDSSLSLRYYMTVISYSSTFYGQSIGLILKMMEHV